MGDAFTDWHEVTRQAIPKIAEATGLTTEALEKSFAIGWRIRLTSAGRDYQTFMRKSACIELKAAKKIDEALDLIGCNETLDEINTTEIEGTLGIRIQSLREVAERLRKSAAERGFEEYFPLAGNKKWQSRLVAEGMRNAFEYDGRIQDIGFGKNSIDGSPSGPFGRAVKIALEAFGVEGNWADAAHDARKNIPAGKY